MMFKQIGAILLAGIVASALAVSVGAHHHRRLSLLDAAKK